MSAWQSEHFWPTSVKTNFTWHWMHCTFSCMPRRGYRVESWLNSGMLRMGFQLRVVWQFSHAMLRGPWGLRVAAFDRARYHVPRCPDSVNRGWAGLDAD